jgi:hypothetical protein
MFLCRCAQAQAVTAAAAPRGRTIPPRRDQGDAPKALTLAFRLRAVLWPEAPKRRPTAALANGLGSKGSPLSFGASPEGAKHEFVAPFQGWVCQSRKCHSATQAAGLGFHAPLGLEAYYSRVAHTCRRLLSACMRVPDDGHIHPGKRRRDVCATRVQVFPDGQQ